jgi:hypothetical protein
VGACYWTACEDMDQIGMGIQPDGDAINVYTDSLVVTGKTVKDTTIYANSIYGLLGNFYDADYGDLKAGYLCQFYPALGFDPADSIKDNQVDSIQLKIMYATHFGDSLAPMEVSVYELMKDLPENYYAYTTPDESSAFLSSLYDTKNPLGKKVYTARNLTISDSLYLANESYNYKVVSVKLPREWGQTFLAEYQKPNHGAYASPEAMAAFFKGLYVSPTFGSGCLLNVEKTLIYIYYTRKYAVNPDSTTVQASVLNVTKEVVQLNTYSSANETELVQDNDEFMYLKTPTGIFSEVTIPIAELKAKMGNKKFSNVRLSIEAVPQAEGKKYVFPFPGSSSAKTAVSLSQSKLLLIEPDSIDGFLEKQRVADNKTTYATTYNSSKSAYVFDNISGILQRAMDRDDTQLTLRLIPVAVAYYTNTDSYYYTTSYVDYASANYLAPSAVTLKKDNLKLRIIAVSQ